MAETAVLAPDTEVVEPDAPVLEEGLDVEGEADTEDTGEQIADTRDFEKELETARNEAKVEALKGYEAEQTVQAYRAQVQRSAQWLSTQAADEITKMLDWATGEVEDGRATKDQLMRQVKPENLAKGLAGQLASSVQTQQAHAVDQLQDAFLASDYKDWRVPPELVRAKEMAISRGDSVALYRVRTEIIKRAVLENDVPAEARKLAAEIAAKDKKAASVAATQRSDRDKANGVGPMTRGGNSVAGQKFTTMLAVDTAFAEGRIDKAEMYRHLARHNAGQLPYS